MNWAEYAQTITALKASVERMIYNAGTLFAFFTQYISSTEQDATWTYKKEDGTTEDRVVPNIAKNKQDRFRISGPLIATDAGWAMLDESTNHKMVGVSSVEPHGKLLQINHNVGAAQVSGFIIKTDEEMSSVGIRVGASVGVNFSYIYGYADSQIMVNTDNGALDAHPWILSEVSVTIIDSNRIKVEHPALSTSRAWQSVQTMDGNGAGTDWRVDSTSITQTSFEIVGNSSPRYVVVTIPSMQIDINRVNFGNIFISGKHV